jgi:pyruvate dehydrogenase (quinone)
MARNGGEILVDTLIAFGVEVVFGIPGDGINGVMEAIRKRSARLRFIQVRHEESAAFMATAYAAFTGKLGCCLATTGPGGIHLLNGLYDAKLDRRAVIAITGCPYHDLIGTFTQQDVDLIKVFQDVAVYNERIMGAAHVENTASLACRTALARRGVVHVSIPIDVQEQVEDKDTPSSRNKPHHTSLVYADAERRASERDLDAAAALLNSAQRVAILAGQGALGARNELERTADLLGAPVVKALLGKAVLPDNHPHCTGGIGLLGTRPSQDAMESCDALLIVGSTFPYIEYYPEPGQARGVQIDRDPTRIGLRYPAEVGLPGDSRETLEALNTRLERKADRGFLEKIQAAVQAWRDLLQRSVEGSEAPMKPGRIAHELGARLAADAIICWDSGHNTGLLARYVDAKPAQLYGGSGQLASMACAVPYAIAAAIAHPDRQVVAFVGDGGLTMLLGELATISRYKLPIKIVVVKNNSLGQIKWEQMQFLGNVEYECDLQPIDFVRVAEGMGLRAWSVADPNTCGLVLEEALSCPGPALVEAVVDAAEPFLPPKRIEMYAKNLEKALSNGTPGAEVIREHLRQEPARTLLGA